MNIVTTLSPEQERIVSSCAKGKNVIVNAVAGSGKTTTIEAVTSVRDCIVVMYGKKCQMETRERIKRGEVTTIHGLGRFFNRTWQNDFYMKNSLPEIEAMNEGAPCDRLLVIDEAQDLRPLYVRLVRAFMRAMGIRNILLVGDSKQCINRYEQSDESFLERGDEVFGDLVDGGWSRLPLRTTYRCTESTINCINRVFVKNDYLVPHKKGGERPYYFYGDWDSIADTIAESIQLKGRLEDHVVLFRSVRSDRVNSPFSKIATRLSYRYPIAVRESEPELTKNKLLITTVHAMKGLERPYVHVFGVDSKWDIYGGEPDSENGCGNLLYVALTRAKSRLFIYHTIGTAPLKWIDVNVLCDAVEIDGSQGSIKAESELRSKKKEKPRLLVTLKRLSRKICQRKPVQFVEDVTSRATFDIVREGRRVKQVNYIASFGETAENVNELYSTAATLSAYSKNADLGRWVRDLRGKIDSDKQIGAVYDRVLSEIENELNGELNAAALCRIAAGYIALRDGTFHRYTQILNYDWVDDELLNAMCATIDVPIDEIGKVTEYTRGSVPCYEITAIHEFISGTTPYLLSANGGEEDRLRAVLHSAIASLNNENGTVHTLDVVSGEVCSVTVSDPAYVFEAFCVFEESNRRRSWSELCAEVGIACV